MTAPDVTAALDLGSTRYKSALMGSDGRLGPVQSLPAPILQEIGGRTGSDPRACLDRAGDALDALGPLPPGTPLGLASQRSSFVVWNRRTGDPVTPLISWRDGSAAAWLAARPFVGEPFRRISGLVSAPWFLAPRLAALQEQDEALQGGLRDGTLMVGTLDTFVLWQWTGGREHSTDPGMASRTGLYDLAGAQWSPQLLALFGVPGQALPEVRPTAGLAVELDGGDLLTATAADLAAASLAALDGRPGHILVNAGTGSFAVRRAGDPGLRLPGFLAGVTGGGNSGAPFGVALEGSVHAGAGILGPQPEQWSGWPDTDPFPAIFSLPDTPGLAAPHWEPALAATLSPAAAGLDETGRRQVEVEGLVFRLAEVVEGLADSGDTPVLMAGGVAAGPLAAGLAAVTGRELRLLAQPEQTLLGAARLAGGWGPVPAVEVSEPVVPAPAWLQAKFPCWQAWLNGLREEAGGRAG